MTKVKQEAWYNIQQWFEWVWQKCALLAECTQGTIRSMHYSMSAFSAVCIHDVFLQRATLHFHVHIPIHSSSSHSHSRSRSFTLPVHIHDHFCEMEHVHIHIGGHVCKTARLRKIWCIVTSITWQNVTPLPFFQLSQTSYGCTESLWTRHLLDDIIVDHKGYSHLAPRWHHTERL